MHLLRSKAVCSYNVRLSFLQSAHTFLKTFLRQMLSLLVFHPAVSKKIELRPFRSNFFSLIMFCSPVPKAQTAIFVTKFSRQTIPNKIEHVFRSKALWSYIFISLDRLVTKNQYWTPNVSRSFLLSFHIEKKRGKAVLFSFRNETTTKICQTFGFSRSQAYPIKKPNIPFYQLFKGWRGTNC